MPIGHSSCTTLFDDVWEKQRELDILALNVFVCPMLPSSVSKQQCFDPDKNVLTWTTVPVWNNVLNEISSPNRLSSIWTWLFCHFCFIRSLLYIHSDFRHDLSNTTIGMIITKLWGDFYHFFPVYIWFRTIIQLNVIIIWESSKKNKNNTFIRTTNSTNSSVNVHQSL